MQEIVLLLSSLAGITTAAAIRARRRSGGRLPAPIEDVRAQSQIKELNMERDVLAKAITRLYQSEFGIPREQKERLLVMYQQRMSTITAQLQNTEVRPGPSHVGHDLITRMDQKLSDLDTRMQDISSTVLEIKAGQEEAAARAGTGRWDAAAAAEAAVTAAKKPAASVPVAAKTEGVTAAAAEAAVTIGIEPAAAPRASKTTDTPAPRPARSFEITTLTSIPAKKKSKVTTAQAGVERAGRRAAAIDPPKENKMAATVGKRPTVPGHRKARGKPSPSQEGVTGSKSDPEQGAETRSGEGVTAPDAVIIGGHDNAKRDDGDARGGEDGDDAIDEDTKIKAVMSDIKRTLEKLDKAEME